jgi:hypothetical protein
MILAKASHGRVCRSIRGDMLTLQLTSREMILCDSSVMDEEPSLSDAEQQEALATYVRSSVASLDVLTSYNPLVRGSMHLLSPMITSSMQLFSLEPSFAKHFASNPAISSVYRSSATSGQPHKRQRADKVGIRDNSKGNFPLTTICSHFGMR